MNLRTVLIVFLAAWIHASSAFAGISPVPLNLTKTFSAAFVTEGTPVNVTFVISNTNPFGVTNVRFADPLPDGLLIASGGAFTSTCGGSVLLPVGLILFSGGVLGANSSCTITVPIVGVPGEYFNITAKIFADQVPEGPAAAASITIIPADDFQVHYANVGVGDSVINITNTGASSPPQIAAARVPTPHIQAIGAAGVDMCVNAYVFSPDEQLVSCCSCVVTPNGLVSLSARNDLVSNTLTPAVPTSLVVKLIASSVTGVAPAPEVCDPSTVTPGSIALVTGLAAWSTSLHAAPVTAGTPAGTFGITETPFISATLSPAELTRITTLCGFIRTNGSGFGICKACRLGGLGADRQSERPIR